MPRTASADSALCIRPAVCSLPGCQQLVSESPLVATFGPKSNLFLAQSKRDLTRSVRVSLVEGMVRWFGIAVELFRSRVWKYAKRNTTSFCNYLPRLRHTKKGGGLLIILFVTIFVPVQWPMTASVV